MTCISRAGSRHARARTMALFMTAGRFGRDWRAGFLGRFYSGSRRPAGWQLLFLLEAYRLLSGHHRLFLPGGQSPRTASGSRIKTGRLRDSVPGAKLNAPDAVGGPAWWSVFVDPRASSWRLVYFCLTHAPTGLAFGSERLRLFSGRSTIVIGRALRDSLSRRDGGHGF